jgi:hypothetical protein
MNLLQSSLYAEQNYKPRSRPGKKWLVCLDYDDTLTEKGSVTERDKLGSLSREGLKLARWLQSEGFGIVILTARKEKDREGIKSYLAERGVKVLKVTDRKPDSVGIVDNKAVPWEGDARQALKRIRKLARLEVV